MFPFHPAGAFFLSLCGALAFLFVYLGNVFSLWTSIWFYLTGVLVALVLWWLYAFAVLAVVIPPILDLVKKGGSGTSVSYVVYPPPPPPPQPRPQPPPAFEPPPMCDEAKDTSENPNNSDSIV